MRCSTVTDNNPTNMLFIFSRNIYPGAPISSSFAKFDGCQDVQEDPESGGKGRADMKNMMNATS